MKRTWIISSKAAVLFMSRKTLTPISFAVAKSLAGSLSRNLCSQSETLPGPNWSNSITLFTEKLSEALLLPPRPRFQDGLIEKVSALKEELLQKSDDLDEFVRVLDHKGGWLIRCYRDGDGVVELIKQLESWPHLALKVLEWRRKEVNCSIPMSPEEYSKGIKVAGRAKNLDLALNLFDEAGNRRVRTTSVYNSLMSSYMWNGNADKCQSLFKEFRKETICSPSVVTCNILISVFGRLLLVNHMEAAFEEIRELNLRPNLCTYNNLIAGYVTAWMWDKMEATFESMKAVPVKPDVNTYMLLLRGYANGGNLERMEETYGLVKDHVDKNEVQLIRAMICAYCRAPTNDRVRKIENLTRLIPKREYRPWLNVLLIKVYAEDGIFESMENSIDEAFEHETRVITLSILNAISASYFRNNDVDKFATFLKRAESGGWRLYRSLYHCKMIMYGSQKRLEEMHSVLSEIQNYNFGLSKHTFGILLTVYREHGKTLKANQVLGMMLRYGYTTSEEVTKLGDPELV